MKNVYYLFIITLICSCKKDQAKSLEHMDLIAPCEQNYTTYDFDSVFYSGTPNFPNANYVIKFGCTDGRYYEFAFDTVPTTGVYSMNDVYSPILEGHVGFKCMASSFMGYASIHSNTKGVFVEANSDCLIISFCNQVSLLVPGFDEVTYSIKIKKDY